MGFRPQAQAVVESQEHSAPDPKDMVSAYLSRFLSTVHVGAVRTHNARIDPRG